MLYLRRYIYANPVVHGVPDQADDWPYSNYLEWNGVRDGALVDWEFVQAQVPHAGAYGEFVAAYKQLFEYDREVSLDIQEVSSVYSSGTPTA